MKKLSDLIVPEFSFETSIQHPLYSFLKITLLVTQEAVDEVEIDSEEILETIFDRAENGNLAAWFRSTIIISGINNDITPHQIVIGHCTDNSFDEFMESEPFLDAVSDLTHDISEDNQGHPSFFMVAHQRPRLVS